MVAGIGLGDLEVVDTVNSKFLVKWCPHIALPTRFTKGLSLMGFMFCILATTRNA